MLSTTTRLPCDEIHIDNIPLPSRNVDILSHTYWFLMFYLNLMAIGALTHKVCYIPLHHIPPIDFPQIALHLSVTWMNIISKVMGFCKDMLSQLTHIRNTQSTMVVNYTIYPFGESHPYLIIDYTLKFKQDWIIVFSFLNLKYKRRFCPILNCYPTI